MSSGRIVILSVTADHRFSKWFAALRPIESDGDERYAQQRCNWTAAAAKGKGKQMKMRELGERENERIGRKRKGEEEEK